MKKKNEQDHMATGFTQDEISNDSKITLDLSQTSFRIKELGKDDRSIATSNASFRSTGSKEQKRNLRRVSTEINSSLILPPNIGDDRTSSNNIERMERLISFTANKLRFSSLQLLGREKELATIEECFARVCQSHQVLTKQDSSSAETHLRQRARELIWIQGKSGTGKSALVEDFIRKQDRKNGNKLNLVQGKVDFFLRDEPLAGFADGFQSLFADLCQDGDPFRVQELRSAIISKLKDDLMVLSTVIPNLQQIVGAVDYSGSCDGAGTRNDGDTSETGNNSNLTGASGEDSQRMKHVFRKLCRILTAHMSTPLVIVMDDAQWADETSLELLEVLMNDQDNARLMCLVCYRSEGVDSDHGVQQLRRRMKENPCSGSTITDIEIENLSVELVNRVIMTVLSIDDEQETLALAEICHRRTMGNVFFLLQFLIMLKEEQQLEFHLGLFKWKWDVETIESTTAATANVVDMVTDRMQKLPSWSFLQLAACLGSHFHVRTLTLAWSQVPVGPCDDDLSKRSDLESMLELAVQEQFIEHVEADSYRWLHDNIQEAALLSIADDRLPSLKVEIGMVLLNSLKEDELEMELFVIANLLTSLTPDSDAI